MFFYPAGPPFPYSPQPSHNARFEAAARLSSLRPHFPTPPTLHLELQTPQACPLPKHLSVFRRSQGIPFLLLFFIGLDCFFEIQCSSSCLRSRPPPHRVPLQPTGSPTSMFFLHSRDFHYLLSESPRHMVFPHLSLDGFLTPHWHSPSPVSYQSFPLSGFHGPYVKPFFPLSSSLSYDPLVHPFVGC